MLIIKLDNWSKRKDPELHQRALMNKVNQIVNLFDIEQIDILRGPQGTLFGGNSTGGAILIRSKRPEFEQSGYLSTGIANNNATSVDAMFNSADTLITCGFWLSASSG